MTRTKVCSLGPDSQDEGGLLKLEPSNQRKDNREQAIAERAYEIYLARGGEEGLAEEDWFKAEEEPTTWSVEGRP